MKFTKFKHKNVTKKGFTGGGCVITGGDVRLTFGHCDIKGCACSEGYYLSVIMPLKNRVVEGIRVEFDDLKEMKKVLKVK